MPLGKASEQLTDLNRSCLSLPWKRGLFKPPMHISLGGYIYEAHFERHDILMLG